MNSNIKKETRGTVFLVIQIVFLILLMLLIIPKLFADSKSDTEFSAMKEGIIAVAPLDAMEEASDQTFKRFYGLDSGDYEGVCLYTPNNTMGVEELLLIKFDTESQKEAIENAINSRLSAQKSNFDGYGVDQTELLNNAVIDIKGNYILYAVGENASDIDAKFNELY